MVHRQQCHIRFLLVRESIVTQHPTGRGHYIGCYQAQGELQKLPVTLRRIRVRWQLA
jgi:hypothetical protein